MRSAQVQALFTPADDRAAVCRRLSRFTAGRGCGASLRQRRARAQRSYRLHWSHRSGNRAA